MGGARGGVSAGNYKFFEMGRVLLFKVFSIVNIGPSAIKIVTTALEAQTRKFRKRAGSTRELLAYNYLLAFSKLNKRYLFSSPSRQIFPVPLWRGYQSEKGNYPIIRSSTSPRRRNLVTSTKDLVYNRVRTVETSFYSCVQQSWGRGEFSGTGGAFT